MARGGFTVDDCGREHVESLDRSGARGVFRFTEGCQWDHVSLGCLHEEQVEVFFLHPVGGFRLHVHFVDPVEHVEVVDIHGAGVSLHRGEYVGQRDSQELCPVAIHVKVQLGNLGLQ